jgi:hypothetical protein
MAWTCALAALSLAAVVSAQTTSTCAIYGDPIVNRKGINAFRIANADGVALEQCLAACTANSNCAGVSHKAGDDIAFARVPAGVARCCCANTCSRVNATGTSGN